MTHVIFAYPGDLDLKTGGYAYDRHLIAHLAALGWSVEPMALGEGFPNPTDDVLAQAERRLSGLPDETLVLIDGLAFGVMPDWAERETSRLRIIALVHHPLALETGIAPDDRQRLLVNEKRALSKVRHVVVTSRTTARELASSFGVSAQKITVALPGTEPRPAAAARAGTPTHILSVGTLIERKGHDALLRALYQVRDLEWRATIIGSKDLNPAIARSLAELVGELRLHERVTLAGECDDVRSEMAGADIFALASRYEGYGMVFAEALSHGLPIVCCKAGAVPDVVPEDAGFLVAVDDVDAFAAALRKLLTNPALRDRMAAASREAGRKLPTWPQTAEIVSRQLRRIA